MYGRDHIFNKITSNNPSLIPFTTLDELFNGLDIILSHIYLNLAAIMAIIVIIYYHILHITKIAWLIYISIRCSPRQSKKAALIKGDYL